MGISLLKRLVITVLVIIVLAAMALVFRFGSALTQEGNPLPILLAIMELELSNNGYQLISESADERSYVAQFEQKKPYGMVKEHMEGQGWTFREQMGSGFIFERGEDTVVVVTRQFSRHYYLWREPIAVPRSS